ncbi:hypothetical protein [Roseibium suaedae]|uniref:Glycosyl transferase n=1 Tax=Roseibium suaedae TaxID=735517 RepID=A0A1M7P7X8_9HYPH|nr:hypothetical protein [Roseibium suaedae]SHN12517.1 hypothetical protein SAMN05444272_4165 [Roseibium suaedae]
MSVHCFTSISYAYLDRARVLGATIKQFHPDWTLWLLLTDEEPEGFEINLDVESWDHLFRATDLDIPKIKGWMFQHDVVELCTAVKGPFLEKLLNDGADKVFYIDPDIALLNPLHPLEKLLDQHSVLLTPHQTGYDEDPIAILDNEVSCLIHGTYNLGFIAVRNDENGRECARWWSARCRNYCYDDKPRGLFVDQKWCDLIPAYFDNVHIVRDPGYNVASWNLNSRVISSKDDGRFYVNSEHMLRFYHFTKLGPIGDTMTRRYAKDNTEVYEIWAWYKKLVAANVDRRIPERYWFYGVYSSGNPIPKAARELYRYRGDLKEAFPNPFDSTNGGYEAWYEADLKLQQNN